MAFEKQYPIFVIELFGRDDGKILRRTLQIASSQDETISYAPIDLQTPSQAVSILYRIRNDIPKFSRTIDDCRAVRGVRGNDSVWKVCCIQPDWNYLDWFVIVFVKSFKIKIPVGKRTAIIKNAKATSNDSVIIFEWQIKKRKRAARSRVLMGE